MGMEARIMLISFSIENFRSIASEQSLSLVAGSSSKKKNDISFPTDNSLAPHLLRSACLFGSNGAGKSSCVLAMDFFRDFVISSAKNTQEGEAIPVTSFKLDDDFSNAPTNLEISFIHEETFYQYGFSVNEERVFGEWLYMKPNAADTRTRTLFQREYDDEENQYHWYVNDTHVKGQKTLWKDSTRHNALFLSTAIQLNSESLRAPFDWIQRYLRIMTSPERLSHSFTAKKCHEDGWKDKVLSLLNSTDIRIDDIETDSKELVFDDADFEILSPEARAQLNEQLKKSKAFRYSVKTYHTDKKGHKIAFDLHEESDGSQLIFSLAGPWLDVLENGYTLIVDELHNSLHPNALKFLVKMFHDPEINKNNAQVIFTSHETSVMSKGFMHQDQIWFLEKCDLGATKLYPLSDYDVRDVTAFQKAYLDGRYGAVPRLKEFING